MSIIWLVLGAVHVALAVDCFLEAHNSLNSLACDADTPSYPIEYGSGHHIRQRLPQLPRGVLEVLCREDGKGGFREYDEAGVYDGALFPRDRQRSQYSLRRQVLFRPGGKTPRDNRSHRGVSGVLDGERKTAARHHGRYDGEEDQKDGGII